jgi:hypothetical protein
MPRKVKPEILEFLPGSAPAVVYGMRKLAIGFMLRDMWCAAVRELAEASTPPVDGVICFDEARRAEVNARTLSGGEVPPKTATTPEELALHVAAMVCSFWHHPGKRKSQAELVYTVALGALRAMKRLAQPTIPEIPARTPPIDPDLLDPPACRCPCHEEDPCRDCCDRFRAEDAGEEPKR